MSSHQPASLDPTAQRLLDAAERLFAQHGFRQTSIRAITQAAAANVAAVHYHFGDKAGLEAAVLQRRFGAVQQERKQRLEAVLAEPPCLEAVVRAIVEPTRMILADPSQAQCAAALIGRLFYDGGEAVCETFSQQYAAFADLVTQALQRARPDWTREQAEDAWRFLCGSLGHTLLFLARDPDCQPERLERACDHLLHFLMQGLGGPPCID